MSPAARPSLRRRRPPGDRRVPGQHRLDLAELDAEAPDLDLLVAPPEVLQRALGAPARHVAGAVHPRFGAGSERSVATNARPSAPAGPDSRAPAPRRRCTARPPRRSAPAGPRVEHVDLRVADRPADRHRAPSTCRPDARRPDRRLGRAVHVPQLAAVRQQRAASSGGIASPPHSTFSPAALPAASSSSRHVAGVACSTVPRALERLASSRRGRARARRSRRAPAEERPQQLQPRDVEGSASSPPAARSDAGSPAAPWRSGSSAAPRAHPHALGRPVEPEVYRTYASCCAALTACTGPNAACSGPPWLSTCSTAQPAAYAGACRASSPAPAASASTTTTFTAASSTMNASRSSGNDGSSGRYAAPAFRIPSSATTIAGVRASETPTSSPGPTPASSSRAANRPAASSRQP